MQPITKSELFGYGMAAIPLAVALPVYLYVPQLYLSMGLDLAMIGFILLVVRIGDGVIDPMLGVAADRVAQWRGSYRDMWLVAMPLVAVGVVMIFNPPDSVVSVSMYLSIALVLTYIGLSAATITYFAMGSVWSEELRSRTQITATRAMMTLVGVLMMTALPQWLVNRYSLVHGLSVFGLLYLPVLVIAMTMVYRFGPRQHLSRLITEKLDAEKLGAEKPGTENSLTTNSAITNSTSRFAAWRILWQPLSHQRFQRLALVYLINGVASAIPAALLLFFVSDVIGRADLTGLFLGIYFVAGICGMPIWVRLSQVFGAARAWLIGMVVSVVSFVWAYFVQAGDVGLFAGICLTSGLALGADLALPPVLLTGLIDDLEHNTRPDVSVEGVYFGCWHAIEKLAMALAPGIALPMLQLFGYQSGIIASAHVLSWTYAGIPCLFKLLAMMLLWYRYIHVYEQYQIKSRRSS